MLLNKLVKSSSSACVSPRFSSVLFDVLGLEVAFDESYRKWKNMSNRNILKFIKDNSCMKDIPWMNLYLINCPWRMAKSADSINVCPLMALEIAFPLKMWGVVLLAYMTSITSRSPSPL